MVLPCVGACAVMAFLHMSDNPFSIRDVVFADSGAVTVRPCFVQYIFPFGIKCDGAG